MAPFSLSRLWSKEIDEITLCEIQGLMSKSILNLVTRQFQSFVDQNNNEEPFEGNKKIVSLIDNYLLWAISHKEDLEFQDAKLLLASIPYKVRDGYDTLYTVVDSLLERYLTVSEDDRIRLCENFDPLQMSEDTIESAIHNNRIRLQPGFYSRLYLAQKLKICNLQESLEKVKDNMEMSGLEVALKTNVEADRERRNLEKAKFKEEVKVVYLLQKVLSGTFVEKFVSREMASWKVDGKLSKMTASTEISFGHAINHLIMTAEGHFLVNSKFLSYWQIETMQCSLMKKEDPVVIALSYHNGYLWAGCQSGELIIFKHNQEISRTQTGTIIRGPMETTSFDRCYLGSLTGITEWKYGENNITCEWTSSTFMSPVTFLSEDARKKIWSAHENGTIMCWEERTCRKTFPWSSRIVSSLVANDFLWVGESNGAICCFNLDGEFITSWKGHSSISCLAFDGNNMLWSGGKEGCIFGWKKLMQTFVCVAMSEGYSGPVRALAFGTDGSIWSGGDDKFLRQWKLVEES